MDVDLTANGPRPRKVALVIPQRRKRKTPLARRRRLNALVRELARDCGLDPSDVTLAERGALHQAAAFLLQVEVSSDALVRGAVIDADTTIRLTSEARRHWPVYAGVRRRRKRRHRRGRHCVHALPRQALPRLRRLNAPPTFLRAVWGILRAVLRSRLRPSPRRRNGPILIQLQPTRPCAETAEMFNYDLANLSLTQGLQLDLVSLLRLEIDTMSGAVLAGKTVDLARLVAAHGLLAKMLPQSALVAPAAAADHVDEFAGAREELARFFAGRGSAIAHRDRRREEEMAHDPDKFRRELETKIQAAVQKHNKTISDPGGSDAQSGRERLRFHLLPPLTLLPPGVAPLSPASPPQSAPPPRAGRGVPSEKMSRVNSRPVPSHYLKQPDEPWRQFIGPDGEIRSTSPWRRWGRPKPR